MEELLQEGMDFASCFAEYLPESGKIILLSSNRTSYDQRADSSLAQKIATAAKKTVVAANGASYPDQRKIVFGESISVFHPAANDPRKNIYETFYPKKEEL